ncbi:MAG: peptidoglycan editing factor PgeF, partial [Rhodobacteraceae bacterium]|nr:peptidoglycan editing factor PgeF [Paracoccaceae bacterium]
MTLEILTSDLLANVRHGFFTRRGGASSGIFSGLNCGTGSSDQSDVVAINRARVASAMQVPSEALVGVHQVHSPQVVTVTGPGPQGKADAMVTEVPGLALSILTADCMPVLLHDASARIVGAVHAGWRGALAGVLEATLDAMEDLGGDRTETVAVIGPCISQRAYEVGPEFMDAFSAEDPAYEWFFANGEGDRYLFDLPGFGIRRLTDAGIGFVDWTRHCTYS